MCTCMAISFMTGSLPCTHAWPQTHVLYIKRFVLRAPSFFILSLGSYLRTIWSLETKNEFQKEIFFLTQLVTAFGLGKIFPTLWFSGCGDNILHKNYLLNKIRNDPCNKTKFWMCMSCGFVHACMLKMSQSMIYAWNDKICVDACSPMVCISRDPPWSHKAFWFYACSPFSEVFGHWTKKQ